MKVIIAGGGIAGQMLTGLLHRKGIQAMVLEKARSYSDVGFSMGLYPFSANTLIEIGAYEDYLGESIAINEYRLCNHEGEAIQSLSLRDTLKKINGEMRTLHRANLLNILMKGASATPPRMGTVISRMEQSDRQVTVVLSDGEEITADLVIGADGIHSDVRANIHTRTEWLDWGFTAFTWWTHPLDETRSNIHEFWGCGAMFGLYPIPDRINAVVSLPTPADLESMNQEALKAYLRENFREYPPLAQKALASLDHEKIFVWPMVDQRAPTWVKGRIALVGDAATGFLPTAGVGASNALKSAQILADELGRANCRSIPQALSLWEQRARPKVEANHEASRKLARMMFARNHLITSGRDLILKHLPVEKIAENILTSNIYPW